LSKADVERLLVKTGLPFEAFEKVYCRTAKKHDGSAALALKEKSNYDCIFWKDGCTVYDERPLQCAAFPFWPELLSDPALWDVAKKDCPGMDDGEVVANETILRLLKEQSENE
jgi:Fe-S-cluster containining protein